MLEGGTTAFAFAAYGAIAAFQGQPFVGAFCYTVVGAILGFLWFNAYPARVIMGDTGALALGSGLAVVALMTEQWVVLPIIGLVFVAEGLSDVLQIVYFKATHGRRILRKAPLHHHFVIIGWSEVQVVMRFWLVGIAGAMVGVALALKV
jgi:phospho-N-acetylmuramoyl-pentapeptide-transferase